MDDQVSIEDAARRFGELVDAAEHGTTVQITRDGKVVARLIAEPPAPASTADRNHKIDFDAIRAHQQSLKGPMENTQDAIRDLRDDYRY